MCSCVRRARICRVVSHATPSLVDHPGETHLPASVTLGARAAFIETAKPRYVAAHIASREFVALPESGHLPTMTRPHDVAVLISAFFGAGATLGVSGVINHAPTGG